MTKRPQKTLIATAYYPVGPWRFAAKLPAAKSDSGPHFGMQDLKRFEDAIAVWIVEHGASSPETLRFLRKKAGLQTEDLAALLDSNRETISRWETGHSTFSRASWLAVAALALDKLKIRRGLRSILEAARDRAAEGEVLVAVGQ